MTAIPQTATVEVPTPQRVERIRFCTRCATTAEEADTQGGAFGCDRVCGRCGMGLMLSAPRRALPGPGAAFLVVTREGRISAVSEAAEALVGEEAGLLDVPVTTTLTSPDGDDLFARHLARAASGGRDVAETVVVPAPHGGRKPRRLAARIASCGPPRAALLVLERASL